MTHCLAWFLWGALLAGEPFVSQPYAEAQAAAAAAQKLFVVDATATWCGPCKRMDKTTWADAQVRELLARSAVAVQVDVDEQVALARNLGIQAMPTVILFRGKEELARHTGYMDARSFLNWVQPYVGSEEEHAALAAEDAALRASDDPKARLDFAYRMLLDARRLGDDALRDMALAHLLWVWDWRCEHPGERSADVAMVSEWARALAAEYPPAAAAFAQRAQAAAARCTGGQAPAAASRADWDAWFELSALFEQDASVLAWYERARDVQGLLALDGLEPPLADHLRGALFAVLARHGREADACRLGLDLLARGRTAVMIYRQSVDPERLEVLPDDLRSSFVAGRQQSLRDALAEVYAVAAAGGQPEAAAALEALLLEQLDDGSSRVALVQAALAHGAADGARHGPLLDAAAAEGLPVDALRARLQALPAGR